MADFRHRNAHYRKAKRKAKAISFLSNISLSGNYGSVDVPCKSESVKDDFGQVQNDDIEDEPNNLIISHVPDSSGNVTSDKTIAARISVTRVVSKELDTPVNRYELGVRRSRSFGRIRRFSGDQANSPVSRAKHDRSHSTQSPSSDLLKNRYHKQLSSEPGSYSPSHGSAEDTSHHTRSKSMVNERFHDESPKVHVLKNHKKVKRNGRVVMVSHHKAPFAIFSHLAYSRRSQLGHHRRDSESMPTTYRVRVSSGGKPKRRESVDFSNIKCIEGVELGDERKTVSYSHMLVPTSQKKYIVDPNTPQGMIGRTPLLLLKQREKLLEDGDGADSNLADYDPNQLDDPELIAGKHKKLFTFESYMVSIIDYAKPSELKREINQKFKERYPRIDLTLSKLRSIKKEMRKIAMETSEMEAGVLAQSYVFFEKLVLFEKVNKGNRKLLAGVCLILAAKLNDIKKEELQNLIKEIEDTLRESRKDLLAFEFPVLVALQFALHTQEHEVMPHYRRILQQ